MSEPVNQHFLPQFYLRGFSTRQSSSQVFVLDKGAKRWTNRSIKSTASRRHYYSPKDKAGNYNYEIEEMFSTIERACAPVLRKLTNGDALTGDEEFTLAIFIAVQWNRVPSTVDSFNDQFTGLLNQFYSFQHKMWQLHPDAWERDKAKYFTKNIPNSKEITLDDIKPDDVKLKTDWHHTLKSMIQNTPKFAKLICGMGWRYCTTDNSNLFITSDCPFFMFDPTQTDSNYGVGLRNENIEITMPLSRNLMFFAGWKTQGRGFMRTPVDMVTQFNKRTCVRANVQIIAPSLDFPGMTDITEKLSNRKSRT